MRVFSALASFLLAASTWSVAAPIRVASLSTITTDLAQHIGGNLVTVFPIVQPGVDPHEFQPLPSDIRNISHADLVLITGKGIEGYLAKLEQTVGGRNAFVNVGNAFPSLHLVEDGKQMEDPHWWHSIGNVQRAVEVIRRAMSEADPAHQADFRRNADAYLEDLDSLQRWANETIAKLPRGKRKLVTSHDAFQYFSRDFGFVIYAVKGVGTDEEPSSKKVAELIKTIRTEGVKAVFFESIENPKVLAEITRETGAVIGGKLYADGLGSTEASTYVEMMRYNITTIVDSLK